MCAARPPPRAAPPRLRAPCRLALCSQLLWAGGPLLVNPLDNDIEMLRHISISGLLTVSERSTRVLTLSRVTHHENDITVMSILHTPPSHRVPYAAQVLMVLNNMGLALISFEAQVTKMLLSGKKIHEVAELLNYGDRPLNVRTSRADSGAESPSP